MRIAHEVDRMRARKARRARRTSGLPGHVCVRTRAAQLRRVWTGDGRSEVVNERAFRVRAVVASDYAGWRPLWDGYNAFYGRSGPTALPEEVTRATWARLLDDGEPVHCLVADDASEGRGLVGLAHYMLHRSTNLIGLTCYLQDLFTAETARGRGVGSALIAAVCDEARRGGAERIYWHTHQSNARARRVYDRVAQDTGFIVYRMGL
jgi:GNAT superfamily N-acetyltransferase